jgi:hypothetical protein
MINLTYIEGIVTLEGIDYELLSCNNHDQLGVNLHLSNDVYNTYYTIIANEVTINGVLQTSAQMIIDTLSNGQS